jgi:hypothetical protein
MLQKLPPAHDRPHQGHAGMQQHMRLTHMINRLLLLTRPENPCHTISGTKLLQRAQLQLLLGALPLQCIQAQCKRLWRGCVLTCCAQRRACSCRHGYG